MNINWIKIENDNFPEFEQKVLIRYANTWGCGWLVEKDENDKGVKTTWQPDLDGYKLIYDVTHYALLPSDATGFIKIDKDHLPPYDKLVLLFSEKCFYVGWLKNVITGKGRFEPKWGVESNCDFDDHASVTYYLEITIPEK